MERDDGEADPGAYKKWCKQFLADEIMPAGDWYRLRCLVLHQGRTGDDEGKCQYEDFRFSHPKADEMSPLHRRTVDDGRILHLDVQALRLDVQNAMQKWFAWVERDASEEVAQHVARNVDVHAQKSVIVEAATGALSLQGQTAMLSVTSRSEPSQ